MRVKLLKKTVTYSIIFAYTFNLMMPTAHAVMGDEEQRFQAGLLKKVSANTSFARNEAERTLPTLRVDLKQKGDSEIFKLKIRETQQDQTTETSNCLFQWKQKGTLDSFAHSGTFAHPWQQFLELKFGKSSGLSVTCRPQVEDGKDVFVPYNYAFNCSTNLTLNHIVTPGYIEVDRSQRLTTIFVEGIAGVCLKSQDGIQNSYVHRLKPAHIRSNEHVLLQAPWLDNMDSIISGKKIFGYFDKQNEEGLSGFPSGALDNSHGQICAEEALQLHGNASINNYIGLIESKSDQVHLSTYGSFKNSQGTVKSHLDLELHAKGPIENGSGRIESRNERACVSTEGSFVNRFGGSVKSFKDLELTIKGQLDNWNGLIDSGREKLILKTGEISNVHGGQITSQGPLFLHNSGDIDNFDGFIESRVNQVQLTSSGTLFNKYGGQVRGKTGLDLKMAGDFKNIFSNLWSEGDITLEANGVEHRGFDALIDGKNVTITAKKDVSVGQSTHLKTQRTLKLSAANILLESPLYSKDVFLKASKGLAFEVPQSVESLDIELKNCPFVYKEDQLQASRRFSLTHNRPLIFEIPLKVKGALDITAPGIVNKTTLAAGGQITLTGTSKRVLFPVSNGGSITSNTKGITINGQGFRHNSGKVACAGNFKFDGPNLQLLMPLNIGRDTHLFVPDQVDIALGECALGNKSYINYSDLSVAGLLHLTLPKDSITFPYDVKTPGRLLLDKPRGNSFYVLSDLMAKKGVKLDMPNTHVEMGSTRFDPIKVQSKGGGFEVNARSLDIIKTEFYAKTGIKFTVRKNPLNIGRSVESTITMLRNTGWMNDGTKNILGCPFLKGDFPFTSSNGTLLFTEGDLIMTSPDGVKINGADIILDKQRNRPGNLTIYTREPVRNEGGTINVPGSLCIHDPWGVLNEESNAILQNCMAIKTFQEFQYTFFHGLYRVGFTLTHPYSQPGVITVGGDLIVSDFESFASKAYIQGQIKHPLSSKIVKVTQEDFLLSPSFTHYYSDFDFWQFCKEGRWPFYELLPPLERRISSNVTIGKPVTLEYSGPEKHVLEGTVYAPFVKVLIKDGATLQIGKIANYQRPAPRKWESAKMVIAEYRPSALFKPCYHSTKPKPWIYTPTMPLSFKMVLPRHVVITPTGFRLADPASEQFLLHPWMTIDAMSRIFEGQLGRAYLDQQNTDNKETYAMGHWAMYELFLKYLEPLSLQNEEHNGRDLGLMYLDDTKEQPLKPVKGEIGPRLIPGWTLCDVEDNGNCFYDAVAHQMQLCKHDFLKTIPSETLPRDSLRLRIQGENFNDEQWTEDRHLDEFVKKFDVILAIIDTRSPKNGYVYYYLGENEEVITHVRDTNRPLPNKKIIKLAATGNHFLSVVSEASEGGVQAGIGNVNNALNGEVTKKSQSLNQTLMRDLTQHNTAPSTALTVQNQCQSLMKIINSLPQKEQDKYKFMMFYYSSQYEDGAIKRDVLLPVSWVSPVYDDPALRNPDGIVGGGGLDIRGRRNATLLNYGSLYGEDEVGINVPKVKNIRTSHTWTEYRVNQHERSNFWGSKSWSETVAIQCSKVQPTTGNIFTGRKGKLAITGALDNENGASIQCGEGGQKLLLSEFNATPAIDTYPVTFNVSTENYSGTVHGVGAQILPAEITSAGGMDWHVDKLNLTGTHIIDQEKDIDMVVGLGHLLPATQRVLANVTAEGGSKTTTVQTTYAQLGVPTVVAALQGNVRIRVTEAMDGVSPIIFGDHVELEGKFDLPGSFLHHSVHTDSRTDGMCSSSHTVAHQDVLVPFPTFIEGRSSITFKGDANLPGTHLKAPVIYDKTTRGLKMPPVVEWAHHRQETTTSSPLAHGNAGSEGGREEQVAPRIDADKVIRTRRHGHMSFINAVLNIGEIQGKYKNKVRTMQEWQRSWSHHHQVIPQSVVIVISMIATYYTGGLVGPALQGLGTAGAMLTAAIKTMVSMATTSLLQNGDPQQAIKRLTSREGLKAVKESAATEGILHKLAPVMRVNMASGQQGVANNLPKAALSNAVKATVQTAMGEPAKKAFAHGLKQTVVETAAATGANYIGTYVKNPVVHKVAQGGAAAVLDVAAGGNRKTALSAGGAAIAAATMAEAFIDPKKIMQDIKAEGHPEQDHQRVFEKKRDDLIAMMGAVTVGLSVAFGGDQAAANFAADNVLHNDVATRITMPQKPPLRLKVNPSSTEKEKKVKKTLKTTAQRKREEQIRKARGATAQQKKQEKVQEAHDANVQRERQEIIQESLQPNAQQQKQDQAFFNLVQEVVHEEKRENKGPQPNKTTPNETTIPRTTPTQSAPKEPSSNTMGNIYASPDDFCDLSSLTKIPFKETVKHLWNLFYEDSKEYIRVRAKESQDYFHSQANRDYLQEVANLPIPGAGMAAFAYEGREIYRGKQTIGGAAFDMVVGIVAGKLVIAAGKQVIEGGKYVWKSAKSILPTRGVTRSPHQVAKHNNFVGITKDPTRGFWESDEFNSSGFLHFDACERNMNMNFWGTWFNPKVSYVVSGHGNSKNMILDTKVLISLEPPIKPLKYFVPFKRKPNLEPRPVGARPFPIEPLKMFAVVDKKYSLNSRQVVMRIRKQEDYKKGQAVTLFSCKTGKRKYGICIAQDVANKLGGLVEAPSGNIWVSWTMYPTIIKRFPFLNYALAESFLPEKTKWKSSLARHLYGEFRTFYPGEYHPPLIPEKLMAYALAGGAVIGSGLIGYKIGQYLPVGAHEEPITNIRLNSHGYLVADHDGSPPTHTPGHTQKNPGTLWDMFKQDWKDGLRIQANTDYLKVFSYLPLPGAGTAALACEGREIYRGNQTVGGAVFDVVVGIVQGKLVIAAGKKVLEGGKYVWQKGKAFVLTVPSPEAVSLSKILPKSATVKPELFEQITATNRNKIGALLKSESDTFRESFLKFKSDNPLSLPKLSPEIMLRAEAEKKSFSYFFRPLALQDLGANPGATLRGTFSQLNDAITVRIKSFTHGDYQPLMIAKVMKNLIKTAQEKGAKTLTIEGTIVDSQFKKYIRQNHEIAPGKHWFEQNKVTISVIE